MNTNVPIIGSSKYDVDAFQTFVKMTVSLSAWFLLYRLVGRRWKDSSPEWRCRVVTLTHATLICGACLWAFIGDWKWPFEDTSHGTANTRREQAVTTVCLGYFLFDVTWCLFHRTEGPLMLAHHVCSVIGLSCSLFIGRWGCELLLVTLLTELSNPFLQLRWLLRKSRSLDEILRDQLIRGIEITFALIFTVARLGIGTPVIYRYLTNPQTDLLGRVGAAVMYFISWGFWFNICAMGMRSLRGRKREHACNGHVNGVSHAKKE